jgi:oligopeptide transport system permease protein
MRPGFWTIVVALCSTGWLSIARFVRNKVIMIRDAEYNIASRCLGTPLRRMITRNVLPYLASVLIMEAALTIPYSIGSEVFLGFIGLGLPLDTVSLGNLVNMGKNSFLLYPYQLAWPTVVLAAVTISFYIVGNAFADASDPRNHV